MHVHRPPSCLRTARNDKPLVFLSGSIEMGAAPLWQDELEHRFQNLPGTLFNPRRDDWDPSWEQSIYNPQFRQQVLWELGGLKISDLVFVYFVPGTKSPITLLEFGMMLLRRPVVVCPPGFWRKGNIDIVCAVHEIPVYEEFDEGVCVLETKIKFLSQCWTPRT